MRKGFTLIELLVVIAIIAILAGILFPVFAQAKASAYKASCLSRIRQMGSASMMYLADSDDRVPPAAYGVVGAEPPHFGALPVAYIGNLLQPYLKNMDMLQSPADRADVRERVTMHLPDPNNFPEPQRSEMIRTGLALKSNYGYNSQLLSPVFLFDRQGYWEMIPVPQSASAIASPADTIWAVTSNWDVCGKRPCGGGLFMVDPPCRLDADGADTFPRLPAGSLGRFIAGPGWYPSEPYTYRWFGNVWPLHGEHTTVVWADGHASSRTIPSLTHGCDVRDDWGGRIYDPSRYIWDLN